MLSKAQAELTDDLLFQKLVKGSANVSDQRAAAEWILWLSRYVSDDVLQRRLDGASELTDTERSLIIN